MSLGLKTFVQAYSRLILFAVGLLLGIQVPSFVDQYEKRVDAHFQEISISISGFQSTAKRLFDGDLEALIAYYQASDDPVFISDANSIRLIVDRYNRISAEQAALENNIVAAALHLIFFADKEFFDEAASQYSYTVPLNGMAILWGLSIALLLIVIIDLGLFGCVAVFSRIRKKRHEGLHIDRGIS